MLAEGYSIDFQVNYQQSRYTFWILIQIHFKDLVGRFTLDSASEFFFGRNIGSLSAGIPYQPRTEHKNPASLFEHPSHRFLNAFTEAQVISHLRSNRPLLEFKEDLVKPLRQIVNGFTGPTNTEALAKRERRLAKKVDVESNEVVNLG